MIGLIDAAVSLGSLIIPPTFDFIKKKFIKSENDTPERTMGSLATTNPEVLPQYVEALSKLKDSQVKYFNRDVIGVPAQWVVNLRAAIRPICVVAGLCLLIGGELHPTVEVSTGVRLFFEATVASWFGHRITK